MKKNHKKTKKIDVENKQVQGDISYTFVSIFSSYGSICKAETILVNKTNKEMN